MSANYQSLDSEEISLHIPPAYVDLMRKTEQNPKYHGEGNVLNHTFLVLDQYYYLTQKISLSSDDKEVLYWAAILHDIGKPKVTTWKKNRWSSTGHEKAGVPIARDILLKQPQISPRQRRRILDLVRWHHLPLRLGLAGAPLDSYHKIAIKTDIRLLGLFSMMDLQGRICENRSQIEDIIYHFNEVIVPYMLGFWGSWNHLQYAYRNIGGAAKNCIWYALKVANFDLIRSILYKNTKNQFFVNTCYLTVGAPRSGKTAYIQTELSDAIVLTLDDPHPSFTTKRSTVISPSIKDSIKTFISDNQPIVINGPHIDEAKRQQLTDIIRGFDLDIHYLFFERTLSEIIKNNQDSDDPLEEREIRQAYHQLLLPHPWEAHSIDIISEPVVCH